VCLSTREESEKWWRDTEEELRAVAADRLAIIEEAGRRRVQSEVASSTRTGLLKLAKQFRGRVEKLPRDWLKRFSRPQKTEPIELRNQKLIIPARAAFGTGEHATTAMSLRLLEKLTRKWRSRWSFVDLGTGSGFVTLAAW